MKPRLPIVFPLILSALFCLPMAASAQSMKEKVRSAVDQSLGEHLKEVFPTNNCEANDSGHNYAGDFTIDRSGEVEGTLRLWGRAKVTFSNRRTGGDTIVDYYAECKKRGGVVIVTKLRWRRGPCMRYENLVGS